MVDYLVDCNYVLSHNIILQTEEVYLEFQKFKSHFSIVIAGGGVVFNNLNEYLFIVKNQILDLPKGKQEAGEDISIAAKREVFEECGFTKLELQCFLAETYHIYLQNQKTFFKYNHWFLFYADDLSGLKPQLEEGITELKWVPEDQLIQILDKTHLSIKHLFLDLLYD